VSALVQLAVSLAMAVLKAWMGREDIQRGERQRQVIERLGLEVGALAWLAEARRDSVRWAQLRLRHGAATLDTFTLDPGVADVAPPGRLRAQRPAVGVVRRDPDG